jgi:hypothetical protein
MDNCKSERGQVLTLFALMLGVMFMLMMAVVDVGFFLHERAKAQQTADAAALAGAQELPDDPELAEEIALQYVEANGMDPNDVEISFRCTSQAESICDESQGTYDTIVVTPRGTAPVFFGGILNITGGSDLCWVDGCDVEATAAGCRGACGPVGNAPVDAVMVIDRTGSMSDSDLQAAKDASKAVLEFFNPSLQHVGFGVLGPSSTSSTCSGSYSGGLGVATGSGGTWLPIGLTDDYQNSDGSLKTSSTMVKTINCLNKSSVGTNLGEPLKAAADHLVANGRPDVLWGIIFFTDGAANDAPTTTATTTVADDTGWNFCDDESQVSSGSGDNNGYETNADDACDNGSGYASDDNSGNSTSTSCTSSGKDRHVLEEFDLEDDINSGATITGLEMRFDAWATGTSTKRLCVDVSYNDGSSWTSFGSFDIGTSETSYYMGNSSNLVGQGLDRNDFDDDDFKIRLTMVSNSTSTDFRLDAVAAKVHFTRTSTSTVWDNHLGPCDYAMQQAEIAKALGIEIYTIGYNLEGVRCVDDDDDSDWDNAYVLDLLEAMATDSDHFFDEPQGGDLEEVFLTIGGSITASGSRLVE